MIVAPPAGGCAAVSGEWLMEEDVKKLKFAKQLWWSELSCIPFLGESPTSKPDERQCIDGGSQKATYSSKAYRDF
jgi:hypothetical protein